VDLISAPASQAFVERLFSVCGMLTTGRRNRMRKSLGMRSWLKVNYDEICTWSAVEKVEKQICSEITVNSLGNPCSES